MATGRDRRLPISHDMLVQFAWYLPVGGGAFLADLASFWLLLAAHVGAVAAATISFCIGAASNYVLSTLLAFRRGRFAPAAETIRFIGVVLVGYLLMISLFILFVDGLGVPPLAAKCIAVMLVLVWNFLGRRVLVFRPELPPLAQRLTTVAVARRRRPGPSAARDGGRPERSS